MQLEILFDILYPYFDIFVRYLITILRTTDDLSYNQKKSETFQIWFFITGHRWKTNSNVCQQIFYFFASTLAVVKQFRIM